MLGQGEDPGQAADLLRRIVKNDPQTASLLNPEILKLDRAADKIRSLKAQTISTTSGGSGGLVV